ncbi:MAG: hypothetical protein J5966_03535 [Lachnospiraceae bacterium]|nr:hypothetical protein [Lachnospiraceae bacterium]
MTTKKKILTGIIIAVSAVAIIRVIVPIGLVGLIFFDSITAKPEVYDEIERYPEYMSFGEGNADSEWNKWGMDESIWPRTIDDVSKVVDYKMVYYNPWDAQYLGYLVMEYPAEDYAAEIERLKAYPSTDYIGYYSVTEEKTYELLAIYADEYNGFVYALTDGKNRIIYAEEIFCNYYMDLDYDEYIPEEYLLDGFDATQDNPYRKKKMNE